MTAAAARDKLVWESTAEKQKRDASFREAVAEKSLSANQGPKGSQTNSTSPTIPSGDDKVIEIPATDPSAPQFKKYTEIYRLTDINDESGGGD